MRAMHGQADQSDESDHDVDVESTVEEQGPASDNEPPSSDGEEEVDVWKVITDEADEEDGGVLK